MTIMADETYTCFFYGTLMAFPVLSRVIYGTQNPDPWQKERLRIRPAILHDHCRHRVRNVDYPGVVPEKGKSVRGTVVEGLSKAEIEKLDYFEGSEYSRREVQVSVVLDEKQIDSHDSGKEGEILKAGTYIWTEGKHYLEDDEWDYNLFVTQKLKNWVGDVKNFEFEGSNKPLFSCFTAHRRLSVTCATS